MFIIDNKIGDHIGRESKDDKNSEHVSNGKCRVHLSAFHGPLLFLEGFETIDVARWCKCDICDAILHYQIILIPLL